MSSSYVGFEVWCEHGWSTLFLVFCFVLEMESWECFFLSSWSTHFLLERWRPADAQAEFYAVGLFTNTVIPLIYYKQCSKVKGLSLDNIVKYHRSVWVKLTFHEEPACLFGAKIFAHNIIYNPSNSFFVKNPWRTFRNIIPCRM